MSMDAHDPDAAYTTAVALALDQLAAQVVRALRVWQVDAILLKGPVLADWLYADGSPRGYGDVDLLVAPQDVAAAREARLECGLPPGEELIDIVDEIGGVGVHPAAAWEILWEASESATLAGETIRVLAPPARALHVALHVAWHGPETIKPLEDLSRALARANDATWEAARDLAVRLNAVSALSAGLAADPAGQALAERLGLPRADDIRRELGYVEGSPVALRLDDVRRAAGPRATARAVGRAILPPRSAMVQRYPQARRGRTGLLAAHFKRAIIRLPQAPAGAVQFARAVRRGRRSS